MCDLVRKMRLPSKSLQLRYILRVSDVVVAVGVAAGFYTYSSVRSDTVGVSTTGRLGERQRSGRS